MILASFFISQPEVLTTSWLELATLIGTFAILLGAYRQISCHQSNCYRLGRYEHGHFKLCRKHHPHVPTKGKIGKAHIDEMTERKAK